MSFAAHANADLALLPAIELVELFRTGVTSPVDVAEAVLARIDEYQPMVNAYCLVDAERALADATASQDRYRRGEPVGRVDGVPIGVKDVFLTAGWPTRRGSLLVDTAGPWDDDAPVVAALRREGAVLLGKTTTPELGWKGVTDSPLQGVTGNPFDPTRTAGGSSGGARRPLCWAWPRWRWGPTEAARSASQPGSVAIAASSRPTAASRYGRRARSAHSRTPDRWLAPSPTPR